MFVTFIFDNNYMGMKERIKWYLKSLYEAKNNKHFIITHEYLHKHYDELQRNMAERFFKEFEMERLTRDEYNSISKGFVPDEIFAEHKKIMGTRTDQLFDLFQNRNRKIEECIVELIEQELENRGEHKVDAIFCCTATYKSFWSLGEHYHCPVITYTFSAIKRMHGYQQTLYTAYPDKSVFCGEWLRENFEQYKKEEDQKIILSNRELLALFGKRHNLPLLKIINRNPQYELGICTFPNAFEPSSFLKCHYTDDDLLYDAKEFFEFSEIKFRAHPLQYDYLGVSRENLKNDPATFILGCKRIAAVQSQILLKAALWNRCIYMSRDLLGLKFLCTDSFLDNTPCDIERLNYYIFVFLIPSELMYDTDYWHWRLTYPSEYEIFQRHWSYYEKYFDLDDSIMNNASEKDRFRYLLEKRCCEKKLIRELLDDSLEFDVDDGALLSKCSFYYGDTLVRELFCLNKLEDGKLCSNFQLAQGELNLPVNEIRFYPFIDVGGSAVIEKLKINEKLETNGKWNTRFYPKNNGYEVFSLAKNVDDHISISILWKQK